MSKSKCASLAEDALQMHAGCTGLSAAFPITCPFSKSSRHAVMIHSLAMSSELYMFLQASQSQAHWAHLDNQQATI